MRIILLLGISILINFSLSGCVSPGGGLSVTSALPRTFTTENILKIRQGMSSDEILSMFGPPKNVSSSICGGLVGEKWRCTTWEYGDFPYDRASFTFNDDNGSLLLNSFDIHRD